MFNGVNRGISERRKITPTDHAWRSPRRPSFMERQVAGMQCRELRTVNYLSACGSHSFERRRWFTLIQPSPPQSWIQTRQTRPD